MNGQRTERALISAVLNTGSVNECLDAGMDKTWFREFQFQWNFIMNRYKRTRQVPSKAAFKTKYPTFRLTTLTDLDFAIQEMREYHAKQSLFAIMSDALENIESTDARDTVTNIHRSLVDLQRSVDGNENEMSVFDDWHDLYDTVKSRNLRKQAGKSIGVPTGYKTLDFITNGYDAGMFIVYAARLGEGKTWAAVNTAIAALEAGVDVQMHTLEQPRGQVGMRFSSFLSRRFMTNGKSNIKVSDLHGGEANLKTYRMMLSGLKTAVPAKLIIDDTPRRKLTTLGIASKIERNKPGLVIVDYLGLMAKQPGDWTELAALSSDFKQMAMDYQIPILVLNQLNRTAAGASKVGAEYLSGADAIGHDADAVITMRQISRRVTEMYMAKWRHGEGTGMKWRVLFNPNEGQIEEVSEERAYELINEDEDDDKNPKRPKK